MPIGYLVAVLVAAVVTAAALAPVPRSWAVGQVVWRLAMQANELPFVVAAWVLAAVALAAAQGNLGGPGGVVATAVAALTLLGLGVVTRRALRARAVAAQALADGLGAGVPAAASAAGVAPPRPWLALLLLPLAVRRRDVVRRKNLSYGPAGRANLLDLYLPRSGTTTGPCLVYLHGGGYRSGRKSREARPLLYRLASQGWVCVSANYRLAGDAPYPAALVDAKRAISWLRREAPSYGGDPASITVAGSSAGAHLAAMAALTPSHDALQPGFEAADTTVAAAVCLYGFYTSPTWIAQEPGAVSSPAELVRSDAPAMLIAHGTSDSFVAVSGAREFARLMRDQAPQAPLVYVELPGAQHTFDLYHSIRFDAVLGAIDGFMAGIGVSTPPLGRRRGGKD